MNIYLSMLNENWNPERFLTQSWLGKANLDSWEQITSGPAHRGITGQPRKGPSPHWVTLSTPLRAQITQEGKGNPKSVSVLTLRNPSLALRPQRAWSKSPELSPDVMPSASRASGPTTRPSHVSSCPGSLAFRKLIMGLLSLRNTPTQSPL